MNRLTIVVPTRNNNGILLDSTHREVESWLVDKYGAFSAYSQRGIWQDPADKKVYQDSNILYEIFTDQDKESLYPLAKMVKEKAQQQCVLVTCEQNIIFECQ